MTAILITIIITTAIVIVLQIIVCLSGPEFLHLDHSEHPSRLSMWSSGVSGSLTPL